MKNKRQLNINQIQDHIRDKAILCKKYNYCLQECVQNFKHFECKITLSKDNHNLLIYNNKYVPTFNEEDEGIKFNWSKSSASCKLS